MEIPELEQVSFSRAICQDCKTKFIFPYNGDMDYGMFYFKGERGTSFGFYNSLNHPLWSYINKTINENTAEGIDSTDFNRGPRLAWVIARCADNIDNQRLTSEILCPQCNSAQITLNWNEIVESRKIPRVSFHQFEGLSEEEKVNEILNLYGEGKSKFPPLRDGRSIWAKLVDDICGFICRPISWLAILMRKS